MIPPGSRPALSSLRPSDGVPIMHRFLAAFLLTLSLALTLSAADWPQFLGPTRDGTTHRGGASRGRADLKPLWKKPVGESHSSPVVAGGLVYAFYQPKGKNADALAAFDAKSGRTESGRRATTARSSSRSSATDRARRRSSAAARSSRSAAPGSSPAGTRRPATSPGRSIRSRSSRRRTSSSASRRRRSCSATTRSW